MFLPTCFLTGWLSEAGGKSEKIQSTFSAALAVIAAITYSSALSAQLAPQISSSLDSNAMRNRPLPLEQAFPWHVSATDNAYTVTWIPAAGHYLYRHAFAFSLVAHASGEPRPLEFGLPPGLKKTDLFFGDVEAYYEPVQAVLDLEVTSDGQASLLIEYQGCADWGFCYPYQKVLYQLHP